MGQQFQLVPQYPLLYEQVDNFRENNIINIKKTNRRLNTIKVTLNTGGSVTWEFILVDEF